MSANGEEDAWYTPTPGLRPRGGTRRPVPNNMVAPPSSSSSSHERDANRKRHWMWMILGILTLATLIYAIIFSVYHSDKIRELSARIELPSSPGDITTLTNLTVEGYLRACSDQDICLLIEEALLNGTQGEPGIQGPRGEQGEQGERGPEGQEGPQGNRGPDGPEGPQGERGLDGYHCWDLDQDGVCNTTLEDFDGDDVCTTYDCHPIIDIGNLTEWMNFTLIPGPPGAKGDQGEQGLRGYNGTNGIQGPRGFNGTDGARGPAGYNGTDGARGPPGYNGTDGARGPPGYNGTDGVCDAEACTGSSGNITVECSSCVNGTDGVEGARGPSSAELCSNITCEPPQRSNGCIISQCITGEGCVATGYVDNCCDFTADPSQQEIDCDDERRCSRGYCEQHNSPTEDGLQFGVCKQVSETECQQDRDCPSGSLCLSNCTCVSVTTFGMCLQNDDCGVASLCVQPLCQPNLQCTTLVYQGCCQNDTDCGDVQLESCLESATCVNGICQRQEKDEDGDGVFCSRDCNDTDPTVSARSIYYHDQDGDGFGGPFGVLMCASQVPEGFVGGSFDCNDQKATINPNATELCNQIDDDCDGEVDEDFPMLWYDCAEGWGICRRFGYYVCTLDKLSLECRLHGDVTPPELYDDCDGLDNDCDGVVDENDDAHNCGACGHACDDNVQCVNGVCSCDEIGFDDILPDLRNGAPFVEARYGQGATAMTQDGEYVIVCGDGIPANNVPDMDSSFACSIHRFNGSEWIPDAFIYDLSLRNWTTSAAFNQAGTILALGAPSHNNSAGVVYLYSRVGDQFWNIRIAVFGELEPARQIGSTVAFCNETLVIGGIGFIGFYRLHDVYSNSSVPYVEEIDGIKFENNVTELTPEVRVSCLDGSGEVAIGAIPVNEQEGNTDGVLYVIFESSPGVWETEEVLAITPSQGGYGIGYETSLSRLSPTSSSFRILTTGREQGGILAAYEVTNTTYYTELMFISSSQVGMNMTDGSIALGDRGERFVMGSPSQQEAWLLVLKEDFQVDFFKLRQFSLSPLTGFGAHVVMSTDGTRVVVTAPYTTLNSTMAGTGIAYGYLIEVPENCTVACLTGFGDCNLDEQDGCETDLTNETNCGACGNDCTALLSPGTVVECVNYTCLIIECSEGYADCNEDIAVNDYNPLLSDGCEAEFFTDVNNCGECGNRCNISHTDANCVVGVCTPGDCLDGWMDCDGNITEGCETSQTDINNCGECGVVCEVIQPDHQYYTCLEGDLCSFDQCEPGYADCNVDLPSDGCEVQISEDPQNCGTCGYDCLTLSNVESVDCVDYICVIEACEDGYTDCNGNVTDGCETYTDGDIYNCGTCNNDCTSPSQPGAEYLNYTSCEVGICTPNCTEEQGCVWENITASATEDVDPLPFGGGGGGGGGKKRQVQLGEGEFLAQISLMREISPPWIAKMGTPEDRDQINAVAADGVGGVYGVGTYYVTSETGTEGFKVYDAASSLSGDPSRVFNTTDGTLNLDGFLVAYGAELGEVRWIVRMSGEAGDDEPISVTSSQRSTDTKIFVAGTYTSTLVEQERFRLYDADGDVVAWEAPLEGEQRNAFLASYDRVNGTFQWATRLTSGTPGNTQEIQSVVTDGTYVYVTGQFVRGDGLHIYSASDQENTTIPPVLTVAPADAAIIFLISYSASTGDYQWISFLSGDALSGDSQTRGYGVALDREGGVYITGHFNDRFLSAYSATDHATPAFTMEVVATTPSHEISWGYPYIYLASFSSQMGTFRWMTQMGSSPYLDFQRGYRVASDGERVYVTGYYHDRTNFTCFSAWNAGPTLQFPEEAEFANEDQSFNVFLAAYNVTNGTALWITRLDGDGWAGFGSDDEGFSVTCDPYGRVYLAGIYTVGQGVNPVRENGGGLSAYSADDQITPAKSFWYVEGGNPSSETINGFAAGYQGINGEALWIAKITTPGYDQGHGVATDGHGGVYVGGYFSDISSPIFTVPDRNETFLKASPIGGDRDAFILRWVDQSFASVSIECNNTYATGHRWLIVYQTSVAPISSRPIRLLAEKDALVGLDSTTYLQSVVFHDFHQYIILRWNGTAWALTDLSEGVETIECNRESILGCGVDRPDDELNCGECGVICEVPGETNILAVECQQGRCLITECQAYFADCNEEFEDACEKDLANDANNCGACGSVCGAPHVASYDCADLTCGLDTCESGWSNCDLSYGNGCEVHTAADTENCGGCGNVCSLTNTDSLTCSSGVCQVLTCSEGYGNCDSNSANGCETNITNSLTNCGACGLDCTVAGEFGYNYTCANSLCTIVGVCPTGYGDCDGNGLNGCETDLAVTTAHCSECGQDCDALAGPFVASTNCSAGECMITACMYGYLDCNGNFTDGCELFPNVPGESCGACTCNCSNPDDVFFNATYVCTYDGSDFTTCGVSPLLFPTDAEHCGGCDTNCTALMENVLMPNCTDSVCLITQCADGYGDCDMDPLTGCEVNLLTSISQCGVCGNNCDLGDPSVASVGCVDGTCVILSCVSGTADCDEDINTGCEADITFSYTSCGSCNYDCEAHQFEGITYDSCVDSFCHIACSGDECDLVPILIYDFGGDSRGLPEPNRHNVTFPETVSTHWITRYGSVTSEDYPRSIAIDYTSVLFTGGAYRLTPGGSSYVKFYSVSDQSTPNITLDVTTNSDWAALITSYQAEYGDVLWVAPLMSNTTARHECSGVGTGFNAWIVTATGFYTNIAGAVFSARSASAPTVPAIELPSESSGRDVFLVGYHGTEGYPLWMARASSSMNDEAMGLANNLLVQDLSTGRTAIVGYYDASADFTFYHSNGSAAYTIASTSGFSNKDAFVAVYSSQDGFFQWATCLRSEPASSNTQEVAYAVANGGEAASDEMFFVVGEFSAPLLIACDHPHWNLTAISTTSNIFLAAYFVGNGTLRWLTQMGVTNSVYNKGRAVTADLFGGVYVVGTFYNLYQGYFGDQHFSAYSADGIEPPKNISARNITTGEDAFVACYNVNDGSVRWTAKIGGDRSGTDRGLSVATSQYGTVHVGGTTQRSGGNRVGAYNAGEVLQSAYSAPLVMNGNTDAFLASYDTEDGTVEGFTLITGSTQEALRALASDWHGGLWGLGDYQGTSAIMYPPEGANVSSVGSVAYIPNSAQDAFIARWVFYTNVEIPQDCELPIGHTYTLVYNNSGPAGRPLEVVLPQDSTSPRHRMEPYSQMTLQWNGTLWNVLEMIGEVTFIGCSIKNAYCTQVPGVDPC